MTAGDLALAFSVSQSQLERFLDGVTDDQAHRRPADGGNPIHWIAGHLLAERVEALGLLTAELPGEWPDLSMFATGSLPDGSGPSIDRLRELVPQTHRQLIAALHACPPDTLASLQPGTMLGEARALEHHLLAYPLHEMYHIGQISRLRSESAG